MATDAGKRRLLVLGGSGFVSGTLARTAVAAGWAVWVVTRGQRPLPEGVKALLADRHDAAAFQKATESANTHWDLVVDCIGYEPADARQDIALARRYGDHLVFISTDFVFDPARRTFPQSEDAEHYATDGYGGNKRLCERELLHAEPDGLAWTIIRPCHIYGPGSRLGCLPLHARDAKLIPTLKSGAPLRLVGGGHFLQQPILARDLAQLVLSAAGNKRTHGKIYCAAGPDMIESRGYYGIVAEVLGVGLKVEETPVDKHLEAHPNDGPFLCHRIYDLSSLRAAGVAVPGTSIRDGLREHVESFLDQ